jgi:autotransporter-associated beta strand protein
LSSNIRFLFNRRGVRASMSGIIHPGNSSRLVKQAVRSGGKAFHGGWRSFAQGRNLDLVRLRSINTVEEGAMFMRDVLRFLFASAIASAMAMPVLAESFWTGGSTVNGNFNDVTNWDTATPDSWRHVNKDGDDGSQIATISEDILLNNLWVGDAGHKGLVNQTGGNATLNAWFQVGGAGVSGQSIYNLTGGTLSTTAHPGSGWDAFIGAGVGGSGLLQISGGVFNSNSTIHIGTGGGTGAVTITGTAQLNAAGTGYDGLNIGDGGGSGELTIGTGSDSPTVSVTGAWGSGGWVRLGNSPGSSGKVTVNSGTVNLAPCAAFIIAPNGGAGEWIQLGGTTNTGARQLFLCETTAIGELSSGALRLKGGVFATSQISPWDAAAGSTGNIDFDGGTLKATQNNSNFINKNSATYNLNVLSGGAVIDSDVYSIAINLPMNGVGGLKKIGSGTLALGGSSHSYTGPTVIEAGTLAINGASMLTSGVTVKSGATLAGYSPVGNTLAAPTVETGGTVAPGTPSSPLNVLGMNLANNSNLKFKFDTAGYSDSIYAYGNVTRVGADPVNVNVGYTGGVLNRTTVLGVDPSYILDSGITFLLPTLYKPIDSIDGKTAADKVTLETDYTFGTVDLVPHLIADPAWNNAAGGDWDNGTTSQNWGTPAVATYPNGGDQRAMFTGSFGGTVPINLNVNPQLSSMIFESPYSESYVISPVGTNSITLNSTIADNWHITVLSGSHTVNADLKIAQGNGGAAVKVPTGSTLTLGGVISNETTAAGFNVSGGGTLVLANAGSTFSGTLAVNNSNLSLTHTASITPTYSIAATGTAVTLTNAGDIAPAMNKLTISPSTNFTKAGTGALNITTNDTAAYSLGNLFTMNKGTFDITNSTFSAVSTITLGNEAGSSVSLTLNGDAVFKSTASGGYIGQNSGRGDLVLNDNARFDMESTAGYINVARQGTGTQGYVTIHDTATFRAGKDVRFGDGTNSIANLTMDGGSFSVGTGCTFAYGSGSSSLLTMSAGTMYATDGFNFAYNTNAVSIANISGGSISSGNYIRIGNNKAAAQGTVNMSGESSMIAQKEIAVGNKTGATGTLNMTGKSTATVTAGELQVAWGGTGTLNLGGSATDDVRVSAATVQLGGSAAANGTINLKVGSSLATGRIYSNAKPASSVVNFNGGILKATASDYVNPETFVVTPFINNDGLSTAFDLNVLAGGAKINVNACSITFNEELTGDAVDRSLALSNSAGTAGRLTLAKAVTNIGPVTIDANTTLVLNNSLTTTLSTVSGAGNLTVAGTSVLNATSIKVDTLTIGGTSTAVAAVPEPGTFALLALAGLAALLAAWRRK